MHRIFRLPALVLMVWATGLFAQDRNAIESVISDQMDAFVERDIDRAWSHASPNIKGIFGNPDNFARMVSEGYPMVWDNSEVRFLELREVAGNLWQKLMVRDALGGLAILDYQMIETPDGWQINAVQILPPPDVGA
ncbi:MAG: DUF4864 domain-containing protein [Rhodobacteraceae bacterium]|nr:DUF4864 domain-containing protein [Paracoccaceae bacterium]